MTLHNSLPLHRRFKARADGDTPPINTTNPGGGPPTTSNISSSTPSPPPTAGPSASSTTSLISTKSTDSSPKSTSEISSNSSSTSTSSSLSTSSTPSSTSTDTSITTTTSTGTSSSTKISVTTSIARAVTTTKSSPSLAVSPTGTDVSVSSISASATPSATSGMSTGAIVGSVAGGIAGVAILGLIILFLLRRWRRNRISDDDFNPEEFVRSPDMSEGGIRASTFDLAPPSLARNGHNVSPSIGSFNMAGQGAYVHNTTGGPQAQHAYAYSGQPYNSHAREDDASDIAHGGPYSSEPQPQASYNHEAYSSFAYSTEGAYAAASQPYHPYTDQGYPNQYQSNHPAPALVAGAPAVPAGRGTRGVDNDDAYGGI